MFLGINVSLIGVQEVMTYFMQKEYEQITIHQQQTSDNNVGGGADHKKDDTKKQKNK